ncbi:MAG: 30S ribosomal protein THX [Omnitrophica WOR_2 bacterium]|jgi:30S ribosomal protein S31
MGKGDKKTKRGKIIMGSHGVRRPKKNAAAEKPFEMKQEVESTKPKARTKASKKTKEA